MQIDPLPPNDLPVGFSDYRLDFLFEEQRCLRSICCVESLPRSLILTSVTMHRCSNNQLRTHMSTVLIFSTSRLKEMRSELCPRRLPYMF